MLRQNIESAVIEISAKGFQTLFKVQIKFRKILFIFNGLFVFCNFVKTGC